MSKVLSTTESQRGFNGVDLIITLKLEAGETASSVIDAEYAAYKCEHNTPGCGCWHRNRAGIIRSSPSTGLLKLRQRCTCMS